APKAGEKSAAAPGRKGMTSWADSDTESDVDDTPPPPKKLDAFGQSESESESESEEEEDEEDESEDERQPSAAGGGVVESDALEEGGSGALTGEDASKILNLSKKERK
ncbi:unnamed protein product, partial [Laminaria digitata]